MEKTVFDLSLTHKEAVMLRALLNRAGKPLKRQFDYGQDDRVKDDPFLYNLHKQLKKATGMNRKDKETNK